MLVVDDDPALRLLCRVNLELEGFRVLEVQRAQGVAMLIEPESSGKQRKLYGSSLEGAYRLWLREREITPSQVQAAGLSQRNSSYVAAVINIIGPVT